MRVLPLASTLGVTRGSFYWHFDGLEDLQRSVVDYWDRWSTQTVIDYMAGQRMDAKKRILVFMTFIIEEGMNRYDPAIRAWALYEFNVAKRVRRVDKTRLGFVRALFREAGFSKSEAEARARLLAVYLIGDPIVFETESPKRRRQLIRARHRVLTEPCRAKPQQRLDAME